MTRNVTQTQIMIRTNTLAVETQQFYARRRIAGSWLATIILCFMGVTLLALFCLPIGRIFTHTEIQYNEGWNAYKQTMTAEKIPLYGTPRRPLVGGTGYPPLSFHLIAWLGRSGNVVAAGRWVSLISFIISGVFVALIVKQGGSDKSASLFAFLLYAVEMIILAPDRIGMNDPQLLAEALCTSGLYFYLRDPSSRRLLCLSAVLFCLAGFTKQTVIAFPLAVAVDLLRNSRK